MENSKEGVFLEAKKQGSVSRTNRKEQGGVGIVVYIGIKDSRALFISMASKQKISISLSPPQNVRPLNTRPKQIRERAQEK